MTTLTIKDLSSTETLDARACRAVRGGIAILPVTTVYSPFKLSIDKVFTVNQSNQQMQQVGNYFGNGSAFQENMHNTVTTNQYAQNNVYHPA
ncbi:MULTISPECIES: hypothetical protein [Cupriavidus]|uniref:Uncharacterized protein n=1 Tax=Cupriavidus pauculus TaxID=82633 RepID=A0A3G8GZZ1_9BURK|nr:MULTISPECIES: hypothetical protein [Cupriavidus]AZG13813.1 hypothetical protein EHF44_10335 [Cupriavidus pauculus]MDT6960171.1 hypothetical protein [Cupriavidus sp. SZY C1]